MSAGVDPSRALKDLGAAAVLGTDRAGPGGESASRLLTRAAVAGTRARAGKRWRGAVEAIPQCPIEGGAVANASQGARLERLLATPDVELIVEWCVLAREHGVRPPAATVPVLLDWWARQPRRSPEVFEVLGERGAWLAGINPSWRKPVVAAEIPADADAVWETGTPAERGTLLMTVRKNDPARGLAMVRATWDADGADERRRFVEALTQGLSPADEAFLEAALDDRSGAVRRAAAGVLTRLAGSALRGRMRERARAMIVAEHGKGAKSGRGARALKIEPPAEFDASWARDGIEEKVASGKGKRAFWMEQLLSATDLAVWSESSGCSPAGVLGAIADDDFFEGVFGAMIASVALCPTQPDAAAWSDAIVAVGVDRKKPDVHQLASVWSVQPVERSEAMRLRCVTGAKGATGALAWRLLASDPRPWSLDFSRRAEKVLRDTEPSTIEMVHLFSPVEAMAQLVHPDAAEVFEGLIGGICREPIAETFRVGLERLRLRAEMRREFRS